MVPAATTRAAVVRTALAALSLLVPGCSGNGLSESHARAVEKAVANAWSSRLGPADVAVDIKVAGNFLAPKNIVRVKLDALPNVPPSRALIRNDRDDPVTDLLSPASMREAIRELEGSAFDEHVAYTFTVEPKALLESIHKERLALMQQQARAYGRPLPCPAGWEPDCASAWRSRRFERDAFPNFDPAGDPSQIVSINEREARSSPCEPTAGLSPSRLPDLRGLDPSRVFNRKVHENGAADGHWVLLCVDPETVEAALQIALEAGEVDSLEVGAVRKSAMRVMFKRGARTVVLMHRDEGETRILKGQEPYLITDRQGRGQLIGMSTSSAVAMKSGQLGMLQFEDCVCNTDFSYVVDLHFTRSCTEIHHHFLGSDTQVGSWCPDSARLVFGANSNIGELIAGAYAREFPQSSSPPLRDATNVIEGTRPVLPTWLKELALDLIHIALMAIIH